MNIIWLFLITTELTVVEARRNETRAAERRKLKRKKKQQKAHSDDVMLDEDQVIVAVSHDDIILVTSDEMIHVKSDSHTEDWEDQDECDNDRYEEEHGEGGHGSCDDHPVKLNQKKECQDPVFWHFCDHMCHSIYKDPTRMPHAYVGKFSCNATLDGNYVPTDLLSKDDCKDVEIVYHVDNSYIKPEDHIAWVASLSILGTLFLVIKFTIFFITNYRTKKKLEKEEALAKQREEIEQALVSQLSDEKEQLLR